ncbi:MULTISPECIES: hypothetical protein [unclassified Bradyrhizobium]|uniref:hypothetical protein n=1 Tax=unclassified Bradyrhizobium TaxID=2631580 RepID=UPI0011435ECE|nr:MULTISPECIES: hypothetical protein [unclassified Bradyrhizobium]MCP1833325.1 hypothetical protein [Bradyrhizobium sp. USDA 4545]MCP1918069.1 hypothetical protein [Bradyrhizobium sp. USDA 4532]
MSAFRNWARKAAVLFLPIAVGACAQVSQQYSMTTPPPGTGPLAWDGAGQDPNLPQPRRHARNASPAVAETSPARLSEADADDRLARKLVICSTCIKRTPVAAQPNNRQDVASNH